MLTVVGPISLKAPITVTANYTMLATDSSLICKNPNGNVTITLLNPVSYPGRMLYVKTLNAALIRSSDSNVVPLISDVAGTAIVAATIGKWALLQSDGTNWVIVAAN
jgi:hypothetical protein